MIRFKYEYATTDGERGSFTVDEHSESIANAEAKMTLERKVGNPAHLTEFNLVCRERAPT
jgi:hypothetical protein